MSRVTILVLSVDEADRLAACLPAALAQADARVVVIDNACEDGTVALCEELGVEVVPVRPRRSYAAAMNAGLAATTGDVLLLNADCVLAPGFLEPARRALAHHGVGSVAPKLLRATGMREEDRLELLDTAGMQLDRRRKNGLVGHGGPATDYTRRAPVFGGDGACVLYRREVLDACAVGAEVFDEDMALWASDADLAWRAQALGWGCTYEPAALAWHLRFYSPSTRAGLSQEHRRLQFTNRLLMLAKNETPGGLLRHAPWILGYEVLALGHVLLRERHLLRGYRDAIGGWPAARRRRRQMRARSARPPFGLLPPR
ncbi:MAG: glycosyltransferase [Solirubrobacterales bacterium]|nr:glycosyltransferase [Solirubrobacterales bacterium]